MAIRKLKEIGLPNICARNSKNVLAVKDADYCKAAGQKFVTLVKHTAIQSSQTMVGTTASVGATLINPGDDLSSLVVRADKLMQLSKKAGKNRVTFL